MRWLLISVGALALACSSGGDPRHGRAGAVAEKVNRCDASAASTRARFCIADETRAKEIGGGVSRWRSPWLSSLFRLRSVRARYALTDAEVRCLIQTFCKGKTQ